MKRFFKSAMALTIAAVIATGCAKDATEDVGGYSPAIETTPISAVAYLPSDEDTRTVIGEYADGKYPVTWDTAAEKETIFVAEVVDGKPMQYTAPGEAFHYTATTTNDKEATFTINQAKGGSEYVYHAYYPYEAVTKFYCTGSSDSDDQLAYLNIPTEQHPASLTTVDPAGAILYATTTTTADGEIEFDFKHVAAYGRMVLTNLPSEKIKSVRFTALQNSSSEQVYLSGTYTHYYASDNDADTPQDDDFVNNNNAVTVYYDNVSAQGPSLDVWFATAPATDITDYTVRVELENGDIYRRQINRANNSNEPLYFAVGTVTKFGVNMADTKIEASSFEYKLVDGSTSKISVNDKFIVVCPSKNTAMAARNGSYRSLESVIINDNTISSIENTVVLTLLDAGDNNYYLYDELLKKYLSVTTTAGTNKMTELDNPTEYSIWSISINNGIATIAPTKDSAYGHIRYNHGTTPGRFTNYTGTNNIADVAIFKEISKSGINISQDSFEVEAKPANDTYEFTYSKAAEAGDIVVSYSGAVDFAYAEDDSDTTGTVLFSVAPNYTNEEQKGEILLTAGNGHVAIVTVTQKPSIFSVSPLGDLMMAYDSTEGHITIVSPDFSGDVIATDGEGKITLLQSSFEAKAEEQTINFKIEDTDSNLDTYIGMITIVRKGESKKSAAKVLVWQYAEGNVTPPRNIAVTSATANRITAEWTPIKDADHYELLVTNSDDPTNKEYEVYYNQNVAESLNSAGKVEFTAESLTLSEDQTYYLYVKSVGSDNSESTWSHTSVSFSPKATTKVIKFENLGLQNNQSLASAPITTDGITLTFSKGTNSATSGNNSPLYSSSNKEIRIYAGNTMTISVTEGDIKSIVFTESTQNPPSSFSANSGSYDTKTYTWTATTNTNSVIFSATAQVRITAITIE